MFRRLRYFVFRSGHIDAESFPDEQVHVVARHVGNPVETLFVIALVIDIMESQLKRGTENPLVFGRALRLREANRQQQSRADREREDAPRDHFSARPDFAGFGSNLAFNKLGTLSAGIPPPDCPTALSTSKKGTSKARPKHVLEIIVVHLLIWRGGPGWE